MTQNSSVRLAIFDFDDTLYDGQSLSDFISFLESKLPLHQKIFAKIRKRFEGKTRMDNKLHKEFLLKGLTFFSKEQLYSLGEEFYVKKIKRRLIHPVLEELKQRAEKGYTIVLASGGFDLYLQAFTNEYQIKHMLTSKLLFETNRFSGIIEGDECLGAVKALAIRKLTNSMMVDWTNSVFYSDHQSDFPTFDMVGERIVVVKGTATPSWVNDGFAKIIVE
jgi:HAD superfamily hydrolase (TIGR01490 family)